MAISAPRRSRPPGIAVLPLRHCQFRLAGVVIFFQKIVGEGLQDRSYRFATSAQIKDPSAQDIVLRHAIGMLLLPTHPLLHHIDSGFGVFFARCYGFEGGGEDVLFWVEIEPAEDGVAEEDGVVLLQVCGQGFVEG